MASTHTVRDPGTPPATGTKPPKPLLGWRVVALFYDFFPALGLWFVVALVFTVAHHDAVRGGLLGFAEFIALWSITGAYAIASWHRGGQTLGMRPWRLRVVAADGGVVSWRAALLRYVVGSASLLLAGAGFWWAWIDRDRLTWHDRASHTRLRRAPRAAAKR